MDQTNEVTLCSLADKKLSVRLSDTEICILPNRKQATLEDLEDAFQKVAAACTREDDEDDEEW